MEALNTIETMKAEMRTLREDIEDGGSVPPDRDKEARVEAPKLPMFKGICDAQVVENFLWHLENSFKCSRVKNDETKINPAVLYLSEMAILWWRRKGRASSTRGSNSVKNSRKSSSLIMSFMRLSASSGS